MHSLRPALIALLVVSEVGLWQWRMVVAGRDHRAGAMTLGAVGALLQITAISQVVSNVHDPLSVGAYALGVGLGVLVGLVAGERLTPGPLRVTVVTSTPGVAEGLWALGWPATAQHALGPDGPVSLLVVTTTYRHEARLRRDLELLDPSASWSSDELRARAETDEPAMRAGAGR